ncbi:MAG: hypothetical protein ACRYGI_14805 [Janthinobacterium lividum]
MRHRSLSGVLYAEDFDAPVPAATAPPVPPSLPVVVEPSFSLIDLRRATEKAEQEGRELERHEAELGMTARKADALVRVADALGTARKDLSRIAMEAAAATADTLLAMVAAVLPSFSATRGHDEVQALLRLLLPAMCHEPHLTVRVHPSLLEALREETIGLLDDGRAVVDWVGSNGMLPGDVSVRWQDGIMVRDTNALCTRVRDLIMPAARPMDYPPIDTAEETQNGE